MIVDCCFEYEYEGGYIDGVINYNDKDFLVDYLFCIFMLGCIFFIFYCEYFVYCVLFMVCYICF